MTLNLLSSRDLNRRSNAHVHVHGAVRDFSMQQGCRGPTTKESGFVLCLLVVHLIEKGVVCVPLLLVLGVEAVPDGTSKVTVKP